MSFSRSILYVAIALAVLVGGTYILTHNNRTVAIVGSRESVGNHFDSKENLASSNQDQDNDGLLDWAEQVWGTNPNNPDTDNDGYKDGIEIAKGYDPTKKGSVRLQPSSSIRDDKNFTQSFASLLGERIINQNQSALSDPNQKTKNIAAPKLDEKELGSLLLGAVGAEAAGTTDNKLVPPPSNPEGKQYVQKIKQVLDSDLRPLAQNIPTFLQNAVIRGEAEGVNLVVEAHKRAIKKIEALTPPTNWADIHEAELALLRETQRFFEDMAQAKNDPLRAYLAMRRYDELTKQAQNLNRIFSPLLSLK